jgi:flagellar motor protein MotB
MPIRRRVEEDNGSDNGHYYISISDLMTSLLFIFILILSYVMLSFVKKEDTLLNNNKYRAELLQSLKKDLKNKNISVEISQDSRNMRLKSDLLFKQGLATISEKGKIQISEIAQLLMIKMHEPKYMLAIDTIFIEGHTDSVPIKASKKRRVQWTNKELSAQRAINTYSQMLIATHNKLSTLKNKRGSHLFSYSGYADTRQRCPEKKKKIEGASLLERKECRSKNRRIEFYFTVNTPDIKKMKEHLSD